MEVKQDSQEETEKVVDYRLQEMMVDLFDIDVFLDVERMVNGDTFYGYAVKAI